LGSKEIMVQKKIKARELLADVEKGLDSNSLCEKYQIKPEQLESIFARMKDSGLLNSEDIKQIFSKSKKVSSPPPIKTPKTKIEKAKKNSDKFTTPEESIETKQITLAWVLSWFLGILFFIAGIAILSENNILQSLFLLLPSILLIPPMNKFIENKFNLRLSKNLKFCVVLVCFIIAVAIQPLPNESENEEQFSELYDQAISLLTAKEQIDYNRKKTKDLFKKASPVTSPEERQSLFLNTCNYYSELFKNAKDKDLKRGVRQQRKTILEKIIPDKTVTNWVGILTQMNTNSQGNASILITFENSVVKIHSNLIEPMSEIYKKASLLTVGGKVSFSGKFLSSSEDYIEELSLTQSGSIAEPEFKVIITNISAKDPGQNSEAIAVFLDKAYNEINMLAAETNNLNSPLQKQEFFLKMCNTFANIYKIAPNDLIKSELRRLRKNTITKILTDKRIENWKGTIGSIGETSEGNIYLTISFANYDITLNTFNNELPEAISNFKTLIKPGTSIYDKVKEFSAGDEVYFSGNFFPNNSDFIFEQSLTEKGSMMQPEFLCSGCPKTPLFGIEGRNYL
jgi:hypothetical protein